MVGGKHVTEREAEDADRNHETWEACTVPVQQSSDTGGRGGERIRAQGGFLNLPLPLGHGAMMPDPLSEHTERRHPRDLTGWADH